MKSKTSNFFKYISAGSFFMIGFILSPLTWWNDILVNFPIAWVIASVLPKQWFKAAFIISYWLTNVLGMLMMHVSGKYMVDKKIEPMTKKIFWEFIFWTTIYSLAFLLLIHFNIVKPIDFNEVMNYIKK